MTFQSQHSVSEEMIAAQRRKIEPVSCYGSLYFAFLEICDKLFSGIPKNTIKSRMRNLGLKLFKAPLKIEVVYANVKVVVKELKILNI